MDSSPHTRLPGIGLPYSCSSYTSVKYKNITELEQHNTNGESFYKQKGLKPCYSGVSTDSSLLNTGTLNRMYSRDFAMKNTSDLSSCYGGDIYNRTSLGQLSHISGDSENRFYKSVYSERHSVIEEDESVVNITDLLDSTTSSLCLLRSELEPDWNNSQLDVTSSTCIKEHNNVSVSRKARHRLLLMHVKQCDRCLNKEMCPVVSELENEVSSFFELENLSSGMMEAIAINSATFLRHKHYNVHVEAKNKPYTERNHVRRCRKPSLMDTSINSDHSDFMEQPMSNRVPVTLRHGSTSNAKKMNFFNKLKQFRNCISKARKGVDNNCNKHFKTLAIL